MLSPFSNHSIVGYTCLFWQMDITSAEEYNRLFEQEQKYFVEMVDQV